MSLLPVQSRGQPSALYERAGRSARSEVWGGLASHVVSMTHAPSCLRRLQFRRSFLITPTRSGGWTCEHGISETNIDSHIKRCGSIATGGHTEWSMMMRTVRSRSRRPAAFATM